MKNFKFTILTIIRVAAILVLCIVFGFIFGKSDFFFSQIIIFSLIALLFYELIRFVTTTSRDLRRLLMAIHHQDYSMSFGKRKLGKSFEDLSNDFNEVIRAFRNVKIEKEAQLQLLQVIIDQINIGVIAIRKRNEIIFINKSAEEILDITGLKKWNIDFPLIQDIDREIKEMRSHGNKLLELQIGAEIKQLAFHVNKATFIEEELDILTFHDIRSEIEQKEIEAWYKLIRILTHEIMNSITPLSSLTETILMLLQNKGGVQKDVSELSNEQISDIRNSVLTIQGRSEGILEFVDAYRKLTNIPHPEFEKVSIREVIENVKGLFIAEMDKCNISFKAKYPKSDLVINADKHLMEQVFINLVSNSIFALEKRDNPFIEINVFIDKNQKIVEITDNGKGIPIDKIDKVFIPFFSTREGGSGIGLSLSKQIIYMHHGRIKAKSEEGKGTTFRIEL